MPPFPSLRITVIVLCSVCLQSSMGSQDSITQVGVEIGGASLVYSLFGSIRPIPNVALNLGVTFWGTNNILFPGSLSVLVGESNSLVEFLGGGVLSLASNTSALGSRFTETFFVPEIGLGYRYWPKEGGFHFRAILYVIFLGHVGESERLTLPLPGLSFGYAF